MQCRLQNATYAGAIHVDFEYKNKGLRTSGRSACAMLRQKRSTLTPFSFPQYAVYVWHCLLFRTKEIKQGSW